MRPPNTSEGETKPSWWADVQRDAAEQLADGTFLSGLVTNLGESDPFIQSLRGAPQLLRRSNEMLRATLSDATRESDKLVHWLEGKSPQPSEQQLQLCTKAKGDGWSAATTISLLIPHDATV